MKKLLFVSTLILNGFFIGQAQEKNAPVAEPVQLVVDSHDNVYFLHRNGLGKITSDGKYIDLKNVKGNDRKTPYTSAEVNMVIDAEDNLYVSSGNTITKYTINDQNEITRTPFLTEFYKYRQKDGPLKDAMFSSIKHMANDKEGNIYILEAYSKTQRMDTSNVNFLTDNFYLKKNKKPDQLTVIRKISVDGMVSTLKNDQGKYIILEDFVQDIIMDADNNLVYTNSTARTVEKIDLTTGKKSLLAGKPYKRATCPTYVVGDTSKAELFDPGMLAINKNGDIFYADVRAQRITKISKGKVSTVAGNGAIQPCHANIQGLAKEGHKDGKALTALFAYPKGIAFDSKGNLFIADEWNNCIRKLSSDGIVSSLNPVFKKY